MCVAVVPTAVMTDPGVVERIHVAPEQRDEVEAVESVEAVPDRGLRGDRYFRDESASGSRDGFDLTLIEAEAVEAAERDYDLSLDPGAHRRNVTTRGVPLNHLVGERFRVGDVRCEGVELCEPCSYLARQLDEDGVTEAFAHRGGLCATILDGGTIEVGDEIRDG